MTTVSASAAVRYVKPSGDDSLSGLTWILAKRTLGSALASATAGDEIWVAAGTYYERVTLKAGVGVYGGFNATETQRSERNLANLSILDGSATGSVITVPSGAVLDTVLDGLIVRNGSAVSGGGLYALNASPTIRNCVFVLNVASGSGGGVYLRGSSAEISDTVFRDNRAAFAGSGGGGGIYASGGSVKIARVVFNGNSAEAGGGLYATGGPILVSSSIFLRNYASGDFGGGIYAFTSTLNLVNNTLVENASGLRGGAIFQNRGSLNLSNNIIAFNSNGLEVTGLASANIRSNNVFGNLDNNYVGVANPTGANGNISVDPVFASVAAGNLHLQPTSPSIDSGNGTLKVDNLDIDGQARIQGNAIDMGADESDGTTWASTTRIIYVKPGGNDAAIGTSWATAKASVSAALQAALPGDNVWVAAGTYTERITLRPGVGLFGGFAGTETLLGQRDIRANRSILDGGAISTVVNIQAGAGRTTVLDGMVIQNGNAVSGGGLFALNASPIIRNTTFINNVATTGSGGGACFSGGYAIVSRCVFLNNQANSGGGVFASGNYVSIQGSTFTSNRAEVSGGGLYASGGELGISSSVFFRNVATYGGAIRGSNDVVMELINSTLVENNATGGGIYFTFGSLYLGNNIVAFNRTAGIYLDGGGTIQAVSNNVHANTGGNYIGMTNQTGTAGNISADPKFVHYAVGDLHLQSGSPSIDAGDNTLVLDTEDIDGDARIVGTTVDQGADEFVASAGAQLASLTLSPSSIVSGRTSTGTVTLSAPAPAGGALVPLSSSNTTVATVPASVTVAEGATTAQFTVATSSVDTTTTVTISASYGGSGKSATLTVGPDPATMQFAARDVAVSGDGSERILLVGTAHIRILRVVGTFRSAGDIYPIGAGWTPKAIAAGPNSGTFLLWTHTSGLVSLWRLNAAGVRDFYTAVGPFSGWSAQDIGVASDGTVRILYTSATSARIVKVTGAQVQIGTSYPIGSGWTARAIAGGPQARTHLLWTHTSGLVSLWRLDLNGTRDFFVAVGPYSGWNATDIGAASDGSSRILYRSADSARIVKVTGATVQIGTTYPIGAGWTPQAIAGGPADKTQLLWTHTSRQISLWEMNNVGVRESFLPMGPF